MLAEWQKFWFLIVTYSSVCGTVAMIIMDVGGNLEHRKSCRSVCGAVRRVKMPAYGLV